jgi:hypothetical protein
LVYPDDLQKIEMLKVLLVTLTLSLLVSSETEVRNRFGVTYPFNSDLPITSTEAMYWIRINAFNNCGSRYISKQKDISNIMLYDQHGKLAGIEVGKYEKPTEPMLSRYYEEGIFEGKTYYYMTAYFVDPNNICGHRTAGKYGDRVWWKSKVPSDEGYVKLPLTQTEAEQNPKWKLGKCIIGMGIHYWYEVRFSH